METSAVQASCLRQSPPPLRRTCVKPPPVSFIRFRTVPPLSSHSFYSTSVHSLLDDSASTSLTEVAEIDPIVAMKKKAVDVLPALRGTSIFLVGIKSAVKTGLGELLADALRYYYFDSDNLVEEAAGGESSGKTFRERDKEGFHESETEVLKQLSSMGRLVVCAGDGAVQSSTNLALLRHGLSIWIDVPLDMVAGEISSDPEVLDQLTILYEEMRGGYATADATISLYGVASKLGHDDLNAVTKEDLALEVLKEIEKLTRVKKMMEEAARPF